ncbi:hypothetical protein NUU61_000015 [Penicillium alfredii]|uniref:FAD-binding FR-type domain-containing protein n=1 Tax=Penicillium alfredii TaxID=1506179 RepID=A0A9W9KQK9_9EURO|nr:uncharacterized protein NUU61_000015 [Penicillium alfredii]KAJ5114256.1 hypothetical protein NUU61_000015 [Penicillium alfredii]
MLQNMRKVNYQEVSRAEPVDAPILLSLSYFSRMFNTIDVWQFESWSHHAFGYIGYAYWGGILLIGMVFRICDWAFHRRREQAVWAEELNAYASTHPLEQLPWIGTVYSWVQTYLITPAPLATQDRNLLGCVYSTRAEALVVFGFWVITMILSVLGYRTFPGIIYWPNITDQILRYSADRTGIMSFANIPLIWLFGGRNNILMWATGWSFATFNIFHRHVARMATVQGVVHSLLYGVIYIRSDEDTLEGTIEDLRMVGAIGFRSDDTIVDHLFGSSAYGNVRGFLDYAYLSFRSDPHWVFLSSFVQNSQSRAVYDAGADVVRLEVTLGTPLLQPSPGEYYFLYQPFRFAGWESHPFTIGAWSYEMESDALSLPIMRDSHKSLDITQVPLLSSRSSDTARVSSEGACPAKVKLIFWIRPYDGWTQQLRRQCLACPNREAEATILLEGPYGRTFPLWRYLSVLMVVGGTGVASAVPYIQDHLRRSAIEWDASTAEGKTRTRNIELVWSARQTALLSEVARRELKPALGRADFQATFFATRTSGEFPNNVVDFGCEIRTGRPNIKSLIMNRANDTSAAGSTLAILVCGPLGMADEARAATHLAMRQGHRSIKYVEESFTW